MSESLAAQVVGEAVIAAINAMAARKERTTTTTVNYYGFDFTLAIQAPADLYERDAERAPD